MQLLRVRLLLYKTRLHTNGYMRYNKYQHKMLYYIKGNCYMTLLMRDQEMMRKGIQQGTMTTLFSLVEDGILTLDEAASRVSMSPEKFKEAMEKSANM